MKAAASFSHLISSLLPSLLGIPLCFFPWAAGGRGRGQGERPIKGTVRLVSRKSPSSSSFPFFLFSVRPSERPSVSRSERARQQHRSLTRSVAAGRQVMETNENVDTIKGLLGRRPTATYSYARTAGCGSRRKSIFTNPMKEGARSIDPSNRPASDSFQSIGIGRPRLVRIMSGQGKTDCRHPHGGSSQLGKGRNKERIVGRSVGEL